MKRQGGVHELCQPHSQMSLPHMNERIRRAAALILLLTAANCGDATTQPPASLIGRFDLFWETFDRQYSYFAYKRINWDSLRTVYRPRAEAATTQRELVTVLKEMVAPLRDVHVKFTTPAGAIEPTFQPSAQVNWDRDLWLNFTLRSCTWLQAKPNLGSCTMNGFAYVAVGSWNSSQFSVSDLDAVIDQYRDAPGMVIDVRPNGGGNDALALALAGRFTTRRTTIGYVRFRDGPRHDDFGPETERSVQPRGAFQFTQPVMVLSGRAIFSSNETFIAAMREMPNVTILGDTTGGSSGNPRDYPLGDGWKYSVSHWIEWTADRRIIEWNGIPPDFVVAWDSAAVRAGRDRVLEVALARLSVVPAVR